jgi:hypothetical protein
VTTISATFGDSAERAVPVRRLIVAGWTGRDHVALDKHIRELEALGVKPPATTPIFYEVAAARATTASTIDVSGSTSSGEVEFVLLRHGGETWVGLGSDHTDREVETYGVTVSKQMCDKPIAPAFWPFASVAKHWDRLMLRAYIYEAGGARVLYQEGSVGHMLAPSELLVKWGHALEDGTLMLCGTLAARGGIRPSRRFEFELEDPVLERRITHGYDVNELPVRG